MRLLYKFPLTLFLIIFFFGECTGLKKDAIPMNYWLTSLDHGILFTKQDGPLPLNKKNESKEAVTIQVDDHITYQQIDGFGFTLTGGSAMHIFRMDPEARQTLLNELFDVQGSSIGVSYLRISMGASDLDEEIFSYLDLPEGETDIQLNKFSLNKDRLYLVPVLKEILKINPDLLILSSPWSPPAWMKTNQDTRGGSLKPEYYSAYANYFVKYIQKMEEEGIHIDAVTIQNEPLHPGNNPSLLMFAEDQATFIKDHLGPAFRGSNISTKIIVYDHNADRPDYPINILNDPQARKYIDGSAFHLYAGSVEALSKVHEAHPDKNIYFTEQWIGAPGDFKTDIHWHIKHLIIGATRNWSRNVLEWNLAADPENKPFTDRGGCNRCLGAVTIDGNEIHRNPAYYIIAHASKFVRPGSYRIQSNLPEKLPNVAFLAPNGKRVLIVMNEHENAKDFMIQYQNHLVNARLDAGAVATYVW